jgi:hypothetical protein
MKVMSYFAAAALILSIPAVAVAGESASLGAQDAVIPSAMLQGLLETTVDDVTLGKLRGAGLNDVAFAPTDLSRAASQVQFSPVYGTRLEVRPGFIEARDGQVISGYWISVCQGADC